MIIDVGIGMLAVGACATVATVGCVAVLGGGLVAHLGSDMVFDDEHNISVGEAVFRTGYSAAAGRACGIAFGQGCGTASGLTKSQAPFLPNFLLRRKDLALLSSRKVSAAMGTEMAVVKQLSLYSFFGRC